MNPDLSPRKRKGPGLAIKMAVYILTGTGLIFLCAFGYNYYYSRNLVLQSAQENARNLTRSVKNKIESVIQGVEKLPQALAAQLQTLSYSNRQLHSLMREMLSNNPEAFALCAAFEPYAREKTARYFAPYFYRKEGVIIRTSLGSKDDNYFRWDWYLIPRELKKPVWCDPYYGEGGKTIIASYSVPFYRQQNEKKEIQGVASVDIALNWLQAMISDISIFESGYVFMISNNGKFVAHPDKSYIMRESVFSVAEAQNRPDIRRIGRKMIHGEEGLASISNLQTKFTPDDYFLYYTPLIKTGWSLGVMIPEKELFAGVYELNRNILFIAVIGFVLMFLIVILISRSITEPIRQLSLSTGEISQGNLDARLPEIMSRDEVGQLSASFENMRQALKEYIANLTETTKAKERIESELQIAQTIQMSFLPKRFPPFPERNEFDLYATLHPAREIGGDLYDYFFLDAEHLFLSVGDVSDKGVPAALFMAVTKTLVKGIAETTDDAARIMEKVNYELCQENDSSMFVTYFAGILNIRTGFFRYSNAGHNPPVLIRNNSDPEWLPLPPGFVLGGLEEISYQTREIQLEAGDTLLLYTDGVTEAVNESRDLFTDQRLLDRIRAIPTREPEEMVRTIMDAVQDFSRNVPQADDITLLAFRYQGT